MPKIVVVSAVDLPVILRDARSVDGTRSVYTRGEPHQLTEITAIQRDILHGSVRDHLIFGRGLSVKCDGRCGDLHSLRLSRDFHRDSHAGGLPDFDYDAVYFK